MLVLTRKQGEQIRIGDDVVLTVVRVKGQAIRLGIEAPQDVRVVRGELTMNVEPVTSGEMASAIVELNASEPEPTRPEPTRASQRSCPDDEHFRKPGTALQDRPLDRCLRGMRSLPTQHSRAS
ncbi:MAG: carbon storage regulator [Planctomycetota bacterium]